MDEFEINLRLTERPTDNQIKKLRSYFKDVPLSEILSGLKFASNRWVAKDAGTLKVIIVDVVIVTQQFPELKSH